MQAGNIVKSAAGFALASCLAASLIVPQHVAIADAAFLKVEVAVPAPDSNGTMHFASVLVIRRDEPNDIRLGIGEPAGGLPSDGEWLLVFGPDSDQRLAIAQIGKLPFAAEAKRAADDG
jgi:hypothetical protein